MNYKKENQNYIIPNRLDKQIWSSDDEEDSEDEEPELDDAQNNKGSNEEDEVHNEANADNENGENGENEGLDAAGTNLHIFTRILHNENLLYIPLKRFYLD